ncbi:MAG: hypothetical protein ACQGVK_06815 [Myxococcota bacterium]
MRIALLLGLIASIASIALGCGGPEPTPEEAAAEELARAGDRIPLLCGTGTRHPDTEAGREALARLDGMRATAKEELAANADARGTHPAVRALLEDFLDLHPCPILTVNLARYIEPELEGHALDNRKLWPDLGGRLGDAVKSLAPSWLAGEGVVRAGGKGEAALLVSYTLRPDGAMSMRTSRGGALVVPRLAADLKIYARHPDGRKVQEKIGSLELPDDFEFSDTVVQGQELTKGAAVRAMGRSLGARVPQALFDALRVEAR